jgi:hypothetical protein
LGRGALRLDSRAQSRLPLPKQYDSQRGKPKLASIPLHATNASIKAIVAIGPPAKPPQRQEGR